MNEITVHYCSKVLGTRNDIHILMPELTDKKEPLKLLYILHGYNGNGSDWLRFTSLERYIGQQQAFAVIPDCGNNFYTDKLSGEKWWTYVSEELPEFIASCFGVSGCPEDTYAIGISMGGYGALKLALKRPDIFGNAISISGVTDIKSLMDLIDAGTPIMPDSTFSPPVEYIFGARDSAQCVENDLYNMLGVLDLHRTNLRLYCGENDALLEMNEVFSKHLKSLGYPCPFTKLPGGHEWGFWDGILQMTLKEIFAV